MSSQDKSDRRKRNRKSKKDRLKNPHNNTTCTIPDCYSCAKNNVFNLTGKPLSREQTLLLSKGLSFIPKTPESEPRELMIDLGKFIQKVKNKCGKILVKSRRKNSNSTTRRMNRLNDTPQLTQDNQRKQTDWPSNRLFGRTMEDAFHAMRQNLADLAEREFNDNKHKNDFHDHNLTRKEHLALGQFTKNCSLVFKRGDKTSCIVVKNREDYIREGMAHLSDTKTYKRLERDHTPDVAQHIRYTLEQYGRGGLLSDHMVRQCLPKSECRTALLYFLTKTHKTPMTLRPIVSQVGSATENVAAFLDHYLQPIVKELPAYLKDSTQFIREITKLKCNKNDMLVTVDVKSLYTCIPNEEGLKACYEAWLNREMIDPQQPPAETLRHLLELVLKLNVLEFNRKHYLQTFGTSMGARVAPAYANVFMGRLEEEMLKSAKIKPKYYKRFIDDIFLIVNCNETELAELIAHMNNQNPSIQFTHEHSRDEITFLDVTVYRDHRNSDKLQVRTYIKPTNKQLYIRNTSHHPPGTMKGVALGETIRYLRTNTDKKQFYKMLFLHKKNLLKRGYPRSLINETMRKVKFSMREEKMEPKLDKKESETGKEKTLERPTFVTRYCSRARRVFRIVQRNWSSLHSDHTEIQKYIKNRPMLAYRANPSLARKLVRAKLKRPHRKHSSKNDNNSNQSNNNTSSSSSNGTAVPTYDASLTDMANIKHNFDIGLKVTTKKCKDLVCPLHGRLKCTNQARSKISGRAYITRGLADCNTKFVVYLIECKICNRQYVGQTGQTLRQRITGHLRKIEDGKEANTVHDHFRKGECRGTRNLRVQVLHVLETVKDGKSLSMEQREIELKRIELLWMDRLMSEYPQGLNQKRLDDNKRYTHYKE